MLTDEEREAYRNELNKTIEQTLEQLAMLHYGKKIKGCLVLVIDQNHVFRLMEAYGSDTLLAMNGALDIAKNNLIKTITRNLQEPEKD